MGIKDTAKDVAAKLRLNSHHTTERFGISMAAALVVGGLLLSTSTVSALSNQREQLSSTTIYTPAFSTSKTQLDGAVQDVYVSTDRTRTMVLMKFSNPDSVSANAENYQTFLTGSGSDLMPQPLKNDVTGEVVVFGSTGYLAVILDSTTAFEPQILSLTVRANSELVYLPGESRKVREDLQGQASFTEFDQWRLFFNPGASEATVSTALDTTKFDPGTVYADLVVAPEEATIEKTMDEQLGQMGANLARINEYESEIRRVNVDNIYLTPPQTPTQIEGDEVTGEPAVEGTESTLALDTDWVSPRGFDLDWREGSVDEGYLKDVVPEGESFVTYLANKTAPDVDGTAPTMSVGDLEWTLSNGALLDDYNAADRSMKPLFDLRNGLAQAYQDYFTNKTAYQESSQMDLIDLEVDLRNVRSSASTNTSEKVLFTY